MKFWDKFIKSFVSLVAFIPVISFAGSFDQSALNGFRYGPNLYWNVMGNTPFVWGQWLPQLTGNIYYTWIEPLDELSYGKVLDRNPTYLKMEASIEISPFYGGYTAGLGLRPFRTNPQVELNFVYESYLYFKSNLEMVTVDIAGRGRIAETWNADYITDNVWKSEAADLDYVQLFDFGLKLEYMFSSGSLIGIGVDYVLSDISTDFDGKSYDYKRNMPVFSRDFLFELQTYGRVQVNENFAAIYETSYFRTGYLRHEGTVEKESLGYGIILLGPQFSWKKGLRSISLEIGGWKRYNSKSYDGSISQEFLVQFEYEGYFSFPFHSNFSE